MKGKYLIGIPFVFFFASNIYTNILFKYFFVTYNYKLYIVGIVCKPENQKGIHIFITYLGIAAIVFLSYIIKAIFRNEKLNFFIKGIFLYVTLLSIASMISSNFSRYYFSTYSIQLASIYIFDNPFFSLLIVGIIGYKLFYKVRNSLDMNKNLLLNILIGTLLFYTVIEVGKLFCLV